MMFLSKLTNSFKSCPELKTGPLAEIMMALKSTSRILLSKFSFNFSRTARESAFLENNNYRQTNVIIGSAEVDGQYIS